MTEYNTKFKTTTPDLARKLLITSSFIIVDVIFAFKMEHCMDFALFDLLCVISSFNYWSDPNYGWKRNLDMIISVPLYFYHILCAQNELTDYPTERFIYLLSATSCGVMYGIGAVSSNPKCGQQCHSFMHIVGVIANMFMYYYLSKARAQYQFSKFDVYDID